MNKKIVYLLKKTLMKTLEELQPLIIDWAKERNIHLSECAPKQRLKLIEECGELASAILKNDIEKQKDAIGDIFIVLVILAEQLDSKLNLDNFVYEDTLEIYELFSQIFYDGLSNEKEEIELTTDFLNDLSVKLSLDLTECANIAWNEIKDRTGKTINGTFIRNK